MARKFTLQTVCLPIIGGPSADRITDSLKHAYAPERSMACRFRLGPEENMRISAVITAAASDDADGYMIEGYYIIGWDFGKARNIPYVEDKYFVGQYNPTTRKGEIALKCFAEEKNALVATLETAV